MKKSLRAVVAAFAAALILAGQGVYSAAYAAAALSGKVSETMSSGGYTYVLLEKDGDKNWVAVPQMKIEKGRTVSLKPGVEIENFTSKTLNRTFKKIIFSAGPSTN